MSVSLNGFPLVGFIFKNIYFPGNLESMRHLKNEVDSIKNGVECGLRLQDQSVMPEAGDVISCFTTNLEPQKTDWDPGF